VTEPTQAQEGQPAGETFERESVSSVEDLKKRVEELEGQVKEKEQKDLYLYAEFDNFKKRAIKERSDLLKFGWEPVARELLQTIDNLERALTHMPPSTDKTLVEGLRLVMNQLKATLQKQGVSDIEAVHKAFDPNLHEAVAQEPSSEHPEGTVVREHMRGYTLHGRLLRPARVVISGGKESA
jgi:molecular chaperone GrpE